MEYIAYGCLLTWFILNAKLTQELNIMNNALAFFFISE
jgi:hypothetical protein